MKCPKCNSERNIKNGKVKGTQRYKCKECHYQFTTEHLHEIKVRI